MTTLPLIQAAIQKAFPGIKTEEVEKMVHSGEVHAYPPQHILCQEGALEKTFYIILDGRVKVTKLIDETDVRELSILEQGDFFGEMALIHDAPRAATVKTLGPTTVLEIRKLDFEKFLNTNSNVSLAIVNQVSRRLRENDEMAIEDLRVKARELATAYQRLAEHEYARTEFLTTIAHNLRTPLTAAYGYIKAIRMEMLQGEALKSALDVVGRNLQEIISLVNDILYLQEMELILLDFQPTDLAAVVVACVEKYKSQAEKMKVNIHLEIGKGIPLVQADSKSIERVVSILLDNAIKFSPEGGDMQVSVSVDEKQVCLSVQDCGVGIPDEALPRLFRRYFRLDEVSGHLFTGSGLGLSIAKHVMDQHQGEIEVHSKLGKGSTFTLRFKRE
ncbi:MAG: cyclic nucleotide-binding domain-containing protein [Anaerolineales bacterium]|nr:MAG: cyclic nucleotide-binding domain-containing protein [Anaerolineales bacterium]